MYEKLFGKVDVRINWNFVRNPPPNQKLGFLFFLQLYQLYKICKILKKGFKVLGFEF